MDEGKEIIKRGTGIDIEREWGEGEKGEGGQRRMQRWIEGERNIVK